MALGEVSGDWHLPGSLVDSGTPCSVDFIHLETNHLTVRYAKFREGHTPEPMFDSGALLSLPSFGRPEGWNYLLYRIKEGNTELFNKLINDTHVDKNKQIRYHIEVDTFQMGSEDVFVPRPIRSLLYDMHDGKRESLVFGVTTDNSRPYAPKEKSPDLSPLHSAVIYKHVRMVEALLDHGCNPKVRDAYGILPIQYAAMMGQWQIYKILKRNMTLDEEEDLDVLMAAGEFAAVVRRCDRLHEIRIHISGGLPQARFDRCVRMVVQQLSQEHINDVEDNIKEVFFPVRES